MCMVLPPSIKHKLHHIPVLHLVLLALGTEDAMFARARLAAVLDVVLVGDDLRADEALLEVGVDDARALRGLPALAERPRARLLRPRREEARQPQRLVGELDRAVKRTLREPVALQELLCLH